MQYVPPAFYDDLAMHLPSNQLEEFADEPTTSSMIASIFREHATRRTLYRMYIWTNDDGVIFSCFSKYFRYWLPTNDRTLYKFPLHETAGLPNRFIRYKEIVLEAQPPRTEFDENLYIVNEMQLAYILRHVLINMDPEIKLAVSYTPRFFPYRERMPAIYLGQSPIYQFNFRHILIPAHLTGSLEMLERLAAGGQLKTVDIEGPWKDSLCNVIISFARNNPLEILNGNYASEITVEFLKELADIWKRKGFEIEINVPFRRRHPPCA
ncbi:hypothetical protein L596_005793 [Steinernema carpocapsae]|uniref:Uncharacterized protein n=1 Tax=Steinernema carpocapsae TaxID=34508 RepID=A0A4U8V4M8_STECR|nr:hypothetical protein L596_005793 [Steinernema carpocapsae]